MFYFCDSIILGSFLGLWQCRSSINNEYHGKTIATFHYKKKCQDLVSKCQLETELMFFVGHTHILAGATFPGPSWFSTSRNNWDYLSMTKHQRLPGYCLGRNENIVRVTLTSLLSTYSWRVTKRVGSVALLCGGRIWTFNLRHVTNADLVWSNWSNRILHP